MSVACCFPRFSTGSAEVDAVLPGGGIQVGVTTYGQFHAAGWPAPEIDDGFGGSSQLPRLPASCEVKSASGAYYLFSKDRNIAGADGCGALKRVQFEISASVASALSDRFTSQFGPPDREDATGEVEWHDTTTTPATMLTVHPGWEDVLHPMFIIEVDYADLLKLRLQSTSKN